jgi:hypothetical protein
MVQWKGQAERAGTPPFSFWLRCTDDASSLRIRYGVQVRLKDTDWLQTYEGGRPPSGAQGNWVGSVRTNTHQPALHTTILNVAAGGLQHSGNGQQIPGRVIRVQATAFFLFRGNAPGLGERLLERNTYLFLSVILPNHLSVQSKL